ncbi:2-dehydropantoate 2-reductase [Novosphingobium sp. SG720]|uniref:ketopantoate reductase family protein n=1 Tax=Novosphingobium sp. SG720 TaxID=2586998 RepID=UPI00144896C3|nr:2-dehydropantoate 2-reductase [Novosphingobium sp. SG720]NKJ44772.1 2-dehydropantoate 2-reductase [Novosphingobium sp. SG720]
MQQIVVIGAGAMGCLFAAKLALAGHAVTVTDVDQARMATIASQGIDLALDDGRCNARVDARPAAEITGPVNLVILFTKGMHSAGAIASAAHLVDSGCTVLTLQNGLGNTDAIATVFPRDRIVWGVTDFPADLHGANAVASHGQGHVWLAGLTQAADDRARAVASALDQAGLNARFDPAVEAMVWDKVAFNSALNALCTLGQVPVGRLDCAPARRIVGLIVDEIDAVAQAEGIAFDRARTMAKVDFALANHGGHKPSMLQDRLAGRRTEIESINGAILAIAARHAVATPTLQTITDLVRLGEPA